MPMIADKPSCVIRVYRRSSAVQCFSLLLRGPGVRAEEFRPLGQLPRPELDIHHGVLVELHLASASDHTGIHGPRQAVVAECHSDIARNLGSFRDPNLISITAFLSNCTSPPRAITLEYTDHARP